MPNDEVRRKRAEHLARKRSPGYWSGGYNPSMLPAVAHHSISSRMLEHKRKKQDPGIKTFTRGVREWSHGAGPALMRSGQRTEGLEELARTVPHAPPSKKRTYRGASLSEARKRPGAYIDDNYSSYTGRERVARRFATKPQKREWPTGGKKKLGTPSVIVAAEGTPTLHIAPAARKYGIGMAEHIRHGKSRVERVENRKGVDYVHVRPVKQRVRKNERAVVYDARMASLAELGEIAKAQDDDNRNRNYAAIGAGAGTAGAGAGGGYAANRHFNENQYTGGHAHRASQHDATVRARNAQSGANLNHSVGNLARKFPGNQENPGAKADARAKSLTRQAGLEENAASSYGKKAAKAFGRGRKAKLIGTGLALGGGGVAAAGAGSEAKRRWG